MESKLENTNKVEEWLVENDLQFPGSQKSEITRSKWFDRFLNRLGMVNSTSFQDSILEHMATFYKDFKNRCSSSWIHTHFLTKPYVPEVENNTMLTYAAMSRSGLNSFGVLVRSQSKNVPLNFDAVGEQRLAFSWCFYLRGGLCELPLPQFQERIASNLLCLKQTSDYALRVTPHLHYGFEKMFTLLWTIQKTDIKGRRAEYKKKESAVFQAIHEFLDRAHDDQSAISFLLNENMRAFLTLPEVATKYMCERLTKIYNRIKDITNRQQQYQSGICQVLNDSLQELYAPLVQIVFSYNWCNMKFACDISDPEDDALFALEEM